MILSTAIRRFDEQLRADGKSPHTKKAYLRDLRRLEAFLGPRLEIATIAPHRLTRFINSPTFVRASDGRTKATASLNRSKTAIRAFFRFLTYAGYIERNPARLIRRSHTVFKPPSYLSINEADRLLRTVKKSRTPIARRDYVILSVLLGTGIRLGSLVALNVGDVVLGRSTIRVNGKGGTKQSVYLSRALKRLLKSHLAARYESDTPVFQSIRGSRLGSRQVELRLAYWVKRSGIQSRCSVHTLRHTFATRLYEQTGDLRLVQRALGHRHVSTTEIYAHIADARLKRAIQNFRIPA